MAADSVEREILISADATVVWDVITDPDKISLWFTDEARVEALPGADGELTWRRGGRNGEKQADVSVPIRVVDAEPFRRFSFRWNHAPGEAPDETNSALVEFTLSEEAGGTRLKVVESGIGAVAREEQARSKYVDEHGAGWSRHFGELAAYVRTAQSEAPRP
ncbi:MAG TPA: SRPBCC domain-containing protein [Solirubrobacteraceae bacterium]|nr:SRPBCC domain-containing protein [Solirubrobacteraceae bacterium]